MASFNFVGILSLFWVVVVVEMKYHGRAVGGACSCTVIFSTREMLRQRSNWFALSAVVIISGGGSSSLSGGGTIIRSGVLLLLWLWSII